MKNDFSSSPQHNIDGIAEKKKTEVGGRNEEGEREYGPVMLLE